MNVNLAKWAVGLGMQAAPWGVPAGIFAVYFTFPAFTESFKADIGIAPHPPSGEPCWDCGCDCGLAHGLRFFRE